MMVLSILNIVVPILWQYVTNWRIWMISFVHNSSIWETLPEAIQPDVGGCFSVLIRISTNRSKGIQSTDLHRETLPHIVWCKTQIETIKHDEMVWWCRSLPILISSLLPVTYFWNKRHKYITMSCPWCRNIPLSICMWTFAASLLVRAGPVNNVQSAHSKKSSLSS